MQGCHGNCRGELYVCAETMVEGTSKMQIKPKGDLLLEDIFTGGFHVIRSLVIGRLPLYNKLKYIIIAWG